MVSIKDFKSISIIGQGANGKIIKVEKDGIYYAKKPFYIDNGNGINEIDSTFRFQHPNIIKGDYIVSDPNNHKYMYLILPLGDSSLKQYRFENKLSIKESIYMMYQILSAVALLHQNGLYHCDIKPENIIMFGSKPVLADMGLSFPFEYNQYVCGTPTYTSPQGLDRDDFIFASELEPLDHILADIYSCGTLFYFLLKETFLIPQNIDPIKLEKNYANVSSVINKEDKIINIEEALKEEQVLDVDFNHCINCIKKMTMYNQSDRLKSILSILQEEPFLSYTYNTPIPGKTIMTKLTNYCEDYLKTTEIQFKTGTTHLATYMKQMIIYFSKDNEDKPQKGNALALFLSYSLLIRCYPLIHTHKETVLVAASIIYISIGYIGGMVSIKKLANHINYMFSEEQLFKKVIEIIEYCKGVIRIPTLYDFALTHDEVKWGLNQLAKNCDFLHYDPKELHEKYVNEVETEVQKQNNRLPKYSPL